MIEVEQPAQPFGFTKRPGLSLCSCVGEGDDIGEPLMIAFVLMVGQKLLERVAQGTFAKENQLSETFIFDGTDPAFREGVQIHLRLHPVLTVLHEWSGSSIRFIRCLGESTN
jgi:hypothetical protein